MCIIRLLSWSHIRVAVAVTCTALIIPAGAYAQQTPIDPATLEIEQLLQVELVSTASKFSQATTHAPASVTVVTADQIRRFGYRTLADVLGSVRGFYTTYDRNYAYIGVRGFARPGDYNTRVLLLVDGYRLNEPVYDQAAIGTDFPLDVSLIERVEVIRGPGASLYGTNAFFAVINVITKSGGFSPGTRADIAVGSLSTQRAVVSTGHAFNNGNEILLAASGYHSGGNQRLFFPEFAVPGVSDGTVADADGDQAASLAGSALAGRMRFTGAFVDRTKQIPTASFSTVFGDTRTRTEDRRAYVSAAYAGPFRGAWTGVIRTGLDVGHYQGRYPYFDEDRITVQRDGSHSLQGTGEVTLNRRARLHLFTVGSEVRRTIQNHQFTSGYGSPIDEQHPATVLGVYAQDEITVRPWLLLNAGTRLDYHSAFGFNLAPRTALVFLPRRGSAVKLLYGRAFRAPNSYELYYYRAMRERGFTLDPETIGTVEAVWESTFGSHFKAAMSAFRYEAEQLVAQRVLDVPENDIDPDGGLYFSNDDRTIARGADAELGGYWAGGLEASLGYGFVRANDGLTGGTLSNSPRHLAHMRIAAPIAPLGTTLAFDVRGIGERRSLDGTPVRGFVLANATATTSAMKRLDLQVSVYNIFNTRYADPAAKEHVQRSIEQDGRTFRVRVIARF